MKNQIPFLEGVRRSRSGLVLGVFKGFADAKGWPVLYTRLAGGAVLLILSGIIGGQDLSRFFVAAFFYLLLAVLLPAEASEDATRSEGSSSRDWSFDWHRRSGPKPAASESSFGSAAAASFTRSDLAELNSQIERLNRRIQRIESVVTDRDYEWERKMNS